MYKMKLVENVPVSTFPANPLILGRHSKAWRHSADKLKFLADFYDHGYFVNSQVVWH